MHINKRFIFVIMGVLVLISFVTAGLIIENKEETIKFSKEQVSVLEEYKMLELDLIGCIPIDDTYCRVEDRTHYDIISFDVNYKEMNKEAMNIYIKDEITRILNEFTNNKLAKEEVEEVSKIDVTDKFKLVEESIK
jgi:hypothetical protein